MAKDAIPDKNLIATILNLAKRVEALLDRQASSSDPPTRILIALAGVPGSGKSTVSAALLVDLAKRGVNDVVVVPMDGFHLTKHQLSLLPDPAFAFSRRGHPSTFNAPAYLSLIRTLKHSLPLTPPSVPPSCIHAPTFCHTLGDPIPSSLPIPSSTRLVIVEGNYTLLDEDPWREVAGLWDERWFVDARRDVVRERLVSRHLGAGIVGDEGSARERVEGNDLVNGEVIRGRMVGVDVWVEN